MGYWLLLLHAHLPYIKHRKKNTLAERWFHEAMTESYLPLLLVLNDLSSRGIPIPISISFSPTLLSMFADTEMQERYTTKLKSLVRLAEQEVQRTTGREMLVARMYLDKLMNILKLWESLDGNLIKGYVHLQQNHELELLTTSATHAFLPLHEICPETIRTQISLGLESFSAHTGIKPEGFWLPECAYIPNVGEILAEKGIRYTFLESHAVLYGSPRPRYGVYSPVEIPGGLLGFPRDPRTSKQVWSSKEGYPGDHDYREFYRDIGYYLPVEYVRPYIGDNDQRLDTGFKYHRITGQTEDKDIYVPKWAQDKVWLHAEDFVNKLTWQIKDLEKQMDRPPVIVSPYDAELFGHWWFEGPDWINAVLTKLAGNDRVIATTGSKLFDKFGPQPLTPSSSSWGNEGYFDYWLNDHTEWIYPRLHRLAKKYLLHLRQGKDGELMRKAGLHLLLAQASDWPFILTARTVTDYAKDRLIYHLEAAEKLMDGENIEDEIPLDLFAEFSPQDYLRSPVTMK